MPSWIGLAKWTARTATDLPVATKTEPGDKTGSASRVAARRGPQGATSQEQKNQQLRRQDPEAHDERIDRRIGNRLR